MKGGRDRPTIFRVEQTLGSFCQLRNEEEGRGGVLERILPTNIMPWTYKTLNTTKETIRKKTQRQGTATITGKQPIHPNKADIQSD